MRAGDITSSGSPTQVLLGRARLILSYTLALFLFSVGVEFIWGIIRMIFHIPYHAGGGLDVDLVGRLVGTIVVGALVYRRLARKHTENYLVLGMPVAIITGLASGVFGVFLGTPARLWLIAVGLVFHLGLVLLCGLVFGAFKVSPNNRSRGP